MAANISSLPSGYLLDTNVVSARGDPLHPHHARVSEFFSTGPGSLGVPVFMSVINITEIGFGILMLEVREMLAWPELRHLIALVRTHARPEIDGETADIHAEIRARIASRFMKKAIMEQRKLKEIETWRDPATNEKLQIEEGDIWLAALAVQTELTLVTMEKSFARYQEVSHPGLSVHLIT